jgi:hypothetical protein
MRCERLVLESAVQLEPQAEQLDRPPQLREYPSERLLEAQLEVLLALQ